MDIKCVLKYPKLLTLETLIKSIKEYKEIRADIIQRKISDLYNLFEFILLDFLNIYCPIFIFFLRNLHIILMKSQSQRAFKKTRWKSSAKTVQQKQLNKKVNTQKRFKIIFN